MRLHLILPCALLALLCVSPARARAGTVPPSLVDALTANGKPGARITLPGSARGTGAYVAKVLQPAFVRKRPGGQTALWRVTPRTVYSHASTQLLVLAARYDDDGRAWLRVALPIRPNRSTGWISADSVRVDHTGYFVSVRTRARDVRVFRHGRQLRRFLAVVGAPATPTPHGLFAVYERTRQLDPNGFIGPWALHLTAFSDVLENFGGGPGRTAIHGRGPAALGDPLGTERSHGCVRVDNSTVQWLRRRLGPGTPVKIS